MYPDLPVLHIPREANAYIPLTDLLLDGAPTQAVEVGYAAQGTRPVTNWAAYPGPKNPQTVGRYLVMIRAVGAQETEAVAIGWLDIY